MGGSFDPARAAQLLQDVEAFARESNRIEGIRRTTSAHVDAHIDFLEGAVTIPALVELVSVLQPDARFRNSADVPGVCVGNHVAPPSGPQIEADLRGILAMRDPWRQHIAYEMLHPFTDGNGRSGRAVWLHRHFHDTGLDRWAIRRGFLHSWYYHTLSGLNLANAHLIAAAPELYAAAKRALNYITNTEGEFGITFESGDMLRAALAKARGDQQ